MSDRAIEPSDVERGEWPDTTRNYVEWLEAQAARIEELEGAAKAVEDWWLDTGMHNQKGAPYCIFAIRAALKGGDT
jgi:hypothetical protein